MPTQDKKRKTWIGRVVLKGLPVKTKRGFKTKTAAAKWEKGTKEMLLNPPDDQGWWLSQVADAWLVNCQKRFKPATCDWKAIIVNNLLEYLEGDRLINDIDTVILEDFLNGYPGKTANRYKRELKTMFYFALKRRIVDFNPLSAIDPYKEKRYKRYVPPAEHVEAVMKAAPSALEKNILIFAYHTLARAGEIRHCKWEDVDFDKETITIWTGKTKTGNKEDATLEMTQGLKGMLLTLDRKNEYIFHRKGKRLTKWWLNDRMPIICRKAKVTYFSLHCIRHHVAALLAYKLSLMEISKILRHKNLTTTDVYLRSLVKIETKGIKVLDEMNQTTSDNVVPFMRAINAE